MSAGRVPGRAAGGASLPVGTGLVLVTGGVGSVAVRGTDYAGPLIGPRGIYSERALGFLGVAANSPTLGEDFDDFCRTGPSSVPANWTTAHAGTGGSYAIAGVGAGGGLVRLGTGATAGSQAIYTNTTGAIPNVATTKWYIAWRFRIPTTPDAQTKVFVGLFNQATTKTISVGFFPALHAANFVLQYDGSITGTALNLGVPVDTAFHVAEMYGTGSTTLNVVFDGVAKAPVVMASPPTDSVGPSWGVLNGTTPAAQQVDADYYYAQFVRI
jgi:hypothetical protein